jgi:HD superfamily phosphodiesterase
MPFLGAEFSVFSYSYEELLGIFLGIFVKEGFVIDGQTLCKLLAFAIDISNGYQNNSYHSFYHAIDVTYVAYFILRDLDVITQSFLTGSQITGVLLAALGHDVLHPGLNNKYQVRHAR